MSITLAESLRDPELFGDVFSAPSFWPWHAVAKLLSGERLDRRELALFRECTGRQKPPAKPVRRLILLAGRRAGKDRFMSAAGVHRAALAEDWNSILSPGEQGVVLLLGTDRKQAKILRRYCEGLLSKPLLAAEIARMTDETIEFRNGASLEIATNDAALVRGRSACAVLGTEVAFWTTNSDASSSDEEVVAAAEPSMAMIPDGGLLVLASSVYRKRGLMYRRAKELHGNDLADDICWIAPSRTMNPALPERVVAKALADDPARARGEYLSQWREDVADFIPVDALEAATDFGVRERAPIAGVPYRFFCDAAGGTGKDSFSFAAAHREADGTIVLDCLRERKPRFVPAAVVKEFAGLAREYCPTGVRVSGDRYSAGWNANEWASNGISYQASVLTKSEIYLRVLPLILSGRVRLLDNPVMRQQFVALERRVHTNGRESIDDSGAASANDDLSNAAAGAIVAAAQEVTIPIVAPILVSVARGTIGDRHFYGGAFGADDAHMPPGGWPARRP